MDRSHQREQRIRAAIAAGEVEVGLYWLLRDGSILQSSLPVSEGIPYDDVLNGPSDHARFWDQLRPHAPALRDLEYDEVPRGRVNYHIPTKTFRILGSKAMLANRTAIAKVKRAFRLGRRKVELLPDEHYELRSLPHRRR